MCYIDAMILKGLATFAVLLAFTPAPLTPQTTTPAATQPQTPAAHPQTPATHPLTSATNPQTPATHPQTPVTRPSTPAARPQTSSPYPETSPSLTPAKPDCNGVPCETQAPNFVVTLPDPKPAPWPIHDRILWAACLVLAFVGYAGVLFLRRIEHNTRAIEVLAGALQESASAATAAATAASETAQSGLLHAQSIVSAERPWVLVTAEPSRGMDSSFEITATNRGRTPATITSALDQVVFASDEAHLPGAPEFKPVESGARFVPIILLPGEAATLKTVRREDARDLCGSDEKFARIESWEERIFLCGKVAYTDLIAPAGKEAHETNWCCWFIHGKQRSALVPAGGQEYNAHS
jgi:hypothetical protein